MFMTWSILSRNYNSVGEKNVDTMMIQASLLVAQDMKGIFDSLGGYWTDMYIHSSLKKGFIHAISFSSNFKTIVALIIG